jgi:hypothetical protein
MLVSSGMKFKQKEVPVRYTGIYRPILSPVEYLILILLTPGYISIQECIFWDYKKII